MQFKWILSIALLILSILVLLARSQEEKYWWASPATSISLATWVVIGGVFVVIDRERLRDKLPWSCLIPFLAWVSLAVTLRPPLPDAIILIPIAITAGMAIIMSTDEARLTELLCQLLPSISQFLE
ncbi:hypothetical protein NKR23_g8518 [Pleurostoma richardsiae]|uniref:Uncharacterized protein n=1 Tax=Pleurostoma richardsiae TaxID=41990 RepID=A0AA38RI30_9PEZI|nr:hypothetical protein NKR23_g8518 [Pleurostoma richardsiae]